MTRGKKKVRLPDESLPYFEFGKCSDNDQLGEQFLKDFPMESAPRNQKVKFARLKAANSLLANQLRGQKLIIKNYSRIISPENVGYGRDVFRDLLHHAHNVGAIKWHDKGGYARSEMCYMTLARKYLPSKTATWPLETVVINDKMMDSETMKIDLKKRKILKDRIKRIGMFYTQQEICTGISDEVFNLFNAVETEVYRKPPLAKPDNSNLIPYMVFNDRDMTKGGRMYGTFWIGCKKELRRLIKINGELTADIDGCAMHVQLLYRLTKTNLPDGDLYLFTDDRRTVAKKLMLLMMNTGKTYSNIQEGRKAVIRTYRKNFDKADEAKLLELICELETRHHCIVDELYKPNWGRLQHTEAAIMIDIIEMGMKNNIVVLPVHDGALCRRSDKETVLSFFNKAGIKASENPDHLKSLPIEETKKILELHRKRIMKMG